MKSLVMTVAAASSMLFATQNIQAQESSEVAVNKIEVAAPVQQDGFVKIETTELPEMIVKTVDADKAGAAVEEAYFNEELKVYKLMLKAEDAESEAAYINDEGKWVKMVK